MKSKKNKSSEVKRWLGIPLCTIKQSHEFKTAKRESGENQMRLLDFWNKHLNTSKKSVLNYFGVIVCICYPGQPELGLGCCD